MDMEKFTCPMLLPGNTPMPQGSGNGSASSPAQGLSTDPRTGIVCRHHPDPSPINKAIANAVRIAGVQKRVSAHTFRHSFATDLLRLY